MWVVEKTVVLRAVPSAEVYRLKLRDYHGTDTHLGPTTVTGATELRAGKGKIRGWVSKQWHGAPVLCIMNAMRVIGDLAATKEVFIILTELIKWWGREPWTEASGGEDDGSDEDSQDNSYANITHSLPISSIRSAKSPNLTIKPNPQQAVYIR